MKDCSTAKGYTNYLASTQSPEFHPQHKGYSITARRPRIFSNFSFVSFESVGKDGVKF